MKVERLSNEEEALLKELIPKHRCGNTMRETETGFVHPARLDLAAVKAMSVYEDDIFIVTPPKSGTTWTQEIVWLLRNDVDVDGAMVNQFYRVPFIEIQSIMPKDDRRYPEEGTEMNQSNRGWFQSHSIEFIRRAPRPRTIKTHLPLSLLPDNLVDKCKVVFVARNVKDVAVSFFYHHGLREGIDCSGENQESFNLFIRLFMRGSISFTPVIPSILEAWKLRHHKNLLFYTYEELTSNLDEVVKKVADFVGINLSRNKLEVLKKQVSFESFRRNPFVNKADELGPSFIRKGIVGDWTNHFSKELNEEFDKWLQDQLRDTDYVMKFK